MGIFTKPKLIEPFQIGRIRVAFLSGAGTVSFRPLRISVFSQSCPKPVYEHSPGVNNIAPPGNHHEPAWIGAAKLVIIPYPELRLCQGTSWRTQRTCLEGNGERFGVPPSGGRACDV